MIRQNKSHSQFFFIGDILVNGQPVILNERPSISQNIRHISLLISLSLNFVTLIVRVGNCYRLVLKWVRIF
jgi:hypothetical protein